MEDTIELTPPEVFEAKAKDVIERVRPYLNMDGGDIEFVQVIGRNVYVKLYGACHGCPATNAHIGQGVGELLREELPDFGELIAVEEEY